MHCAHEVSKEQATLLIELVTNRTLSLARKTADFGLCPECSARLILLAMLGTFKEASDIKAEKMISIVMSSLEKAFDIDIISIEDAERMNKRDIEAILDVLIKK